MLLVQGEEEGQTPRWNEMDDGVVGGRGLPSVWASGHLLVQPNVFCCYWCSRQHMEVPKPLDVVSRRNYLTALRLWIFSFCHNYSAPYDTASESFIWTRFSLPLKRQCEHQRLEEESYGRRGSLWVTVTCWTSVSKYVRFSLEPISQSITVIFHRWMDGQTSNKMSCRVSSWEVQVQRCPEVPSSSVILWMCDWYFGSRDITWHICQWLVIFMKIQYSLGKASRKYESFGGVWERDKLVIRWPK